MLQPEATEAAVAKIDRLSALARTGDEPALESEIVRLRYELGRELLDEFARDPGPARAPPSAGMDPFPEVQGRPPEIDRSDIDADVVRGTLRHHGCLFVHNFFPPATMEILRGDIDLVSDGFDRWMVSGQQTITPPWFEPLDAPGAQLPLPIRASCGPLGTFYAGDSPRGMRHLIDAFDAAGMRELVSSYMGEPALLSVEKTSLRHLPTTLPLAWHQDGINFGADVGLINVWVALCQCGVDAPGLGILPMRPSEILPRDVESDVPWEIERGALARIAGDQPLLELEFEPGDAVIFDEMLVHSTVAKPTMTRRRYGADSWFFPVSAFPVDLYVPLAYTA